jgi:transposase
MITGRRSAALVGHLVGDDPNPVRHQVVELPAVKPLVDEHRGHQLVARAAA